MQLPAITKDDIIRASRRDSLIIETAQQVIKDFGEFGLEITFSGNAGTFYEELYNQMWQNIGTLMQESASRFQALLYRIDISQRDIDHYHRQTPNAHYTDVLTELIIHREIKKVMIRDYFRNQKPAGPSDIEPYNDTK